MALSDNELRSGRIVTYCGPETDWQPKVAIQERGHILRLSSEPRFKARVFDNIREAVYWARDNGFNYVTMLASMVTVPNSNEQ